MRRLLSYAMLRVQASAQYNSRKTPFGRCRRERARVSGRTSIGRTGRTSILLALVKVNLDQASIVSCSINSLSVRVQNSGPTTQYPSCLDHSIPGFTTTQIQNPNSTWVLLPLTPVKNLKFISASGEEISLGFSLSPSNADAQSTIWSRTVDPPPGLPGLVICRPSTGETTRFVSL